MDSLICDPFDSAKSTRSWVISLATSIEMSPDLLGVKHAAIAANAPIKATQIIKIRVDFFESSIANSGETDRHIKDAAKAKIESCLTFSEMSMM